VDSAADLDLSQVALLLEKRNLDASAAQRGGRCETADTAADHERPFPHDATFLSARLNHTELRRSTRSLQLPLPCVTTDRIDPLEA
jgi:hypothetical protein